MNFLKRYVRPVIVLILTILVFIFIFKEFQLTSVFSPGNEIIIIAIIILLVIIPTYIFNPDSYRHAEQVINDSRKDKFDYIKKETTLFLASVLIYGLYRILLFQALEVRGSAYGYFATILLIAFWIFLAFSVVRFLFAIVDVNTSDKEPKKK